MLGAATDGLHRGPHVPVAWHQLPARGNKVTCFNPAPGIQRLEFPLNMVSQDAGPNHVAVAFYHSVCGAQFRRFLGIKRRVNSTKNHSRSPLAGRVANLVSAKYVARVNADADRSEEH